MKPTKKKIETSGKNCNDNVIMVYPVEIWIWWDRKNERKISNEMANEMANERSEWLTEVYEMLGYKS